jgi:diacylglycerol kinase family enzyme
VPTFFLDHHYFTTMMMFQRHATAFALTFRNGHILVASLLLLMLSSSASAFSPCRRKVKKGNNNAIARIHNSFLQISANPILPASREEPLAIPPSFAPRKTAIVLNMNARLVSPDLTGVAESVFGRENVFVTYSQEEAKDAASHIIQQKYSLIVPVGGDGTLSHIINYLCQELMHRDGCDSLEQAMGELPLLGYIPLGTGNGVGSVVGCRVKRDGILPGSKRRRRKQLRNVMERLKAVGEQHPNKDYEIVEMPMIKVQMQDMDKNAEELCFFAGIGFDSLMLNDFKRIKAWSKRTGFLTRMLSSVAGYCVALVIKTLPKATLGKHNIYVKLTTRDNNTLWVDHRRGDMVRRVEDNELYSGTTGILAAGTSPYYGGGLRLFPFARMTVDKMHLRLGRIHPLVGFLNIPQIFAGSYRDRSDRFGCIDFIGGDFEVQVLGRGKEKGFPFQHSGESVGHVEQFRLQVVKEPVRFVSFMERRMRRQRLENITQK